MSGLSDDHNLSGTENMGKIQRKTEKINSDGGLF